MPAATVVRQYAEEASDSEMAAEEGFYEQENGRGARKCGVAMIVLGVFGLIATIINTAGSWTAPAVNEAPKISNTPSANKAEVKASHIEETPWHKAAEGSTWKVGSASIGQVHAEARPRSLTVAEFMQTPKFSSQMADQVRRLKDGNLDASKPTYLSPDQQVQSHRAASESIGKFLGDLATSHPKVAMMMHDLRLDDDQQEVVHNSIDHFTSEKTIKLGSEVMGAALESTFTGKDAFKKKLQAKLGKSLQPLHELRKEIFPSDFDPEQKSSGKLQDSVTKGDDSDTTRLQMLKQSERHFSNKQVARRLEEEEKETFGPIEITKLASSVLAVVVSKIFTLAIPSKVGEIIAMSLESVEAIVDCATLGMEKYGWIECVIHGVGAALEAVSVFTKPEEEEKKND
eukprot:gnl/TRDRNA2_/TRDRNA2_199910_c0_seq1.p1 gnl/TRDRNA2_/TRDRNA2_199910_c0~~gnl/TRDRNA2_/TRDRNA2_199910_c0_seq1.p1  ORF type:complete len:401 (-),score=88.84 gnl/TRDRNA2_/TRDRNA2_199910_c0_seq1:76-1278(-)